MSLAIAESRLELESSGKYSQERKVECTVDIEKERIAFVRLFRVLSRAIFRDLFKVN